MYLSYWPDNSMLGILTRCLEAPVRQGLLVSSVAIEAEGGQEDHREERHDHLVDTEYTKLQVIP